MINYQIVNGNYTFKNKLDKQSVKNIILTGTSDRACFIFKNENGFVENYYICNDDMEIKLDNILKEDIERLVS